MENKKRRTDPEFSGTGLEHRDNASTRNLPPEILSLIVEFFHAWNEWETLQKISLVDRNWKAAAQARLFMRVEIDNGQECKFWNRKFKDFPHLGRYVRQLCLSDDDDCLGRAYLRTRTAKTLISSLPCVTGLDLVDIKRWGPVEARLVKGLSRSVRTLWVTDIRGMCRVKDLPDLLFSFPNVDDFTPGEIGDGYDEGNLEHTRNTGLEMRELAPRDGKARTLRTITLLNVGLSVDHLLWLTGPAFDLSGLRSLTLAWSCFDSLDSCDFKALDDFISLIGRSVTSLTLNIPGSRVYRLSQVPSVRAYNPEDLVTEHLVSSPALQHFTALETVAFNMLEDDKSYNDSFASNLFVCNTKFMLQATSGSACHLKKLNLTSRYRYGRFYLGFTVNATLNLGWNLFDDMLADDKAFPSLQLVVLDVIVEPAAYPERRFPTWTEFSEGIRGQLSKTISKRTVKVILVDGDEGERLAIPNGTGVLTADTQSSAGSGTVQASSAQAAPVLE
ncbi:hypothetical protein AAF712_016136 [Marasmius tenuissimus]|uniref:F-box domain-containing protein n=1 Tax=Marasmius tenuissimus TaxID=585030 RepID=A0ABR2Z7L9_9AGAR